jgi:hypothetical protein
MGNAPKGLTFEASSRDKAHAIVKMWLESDDTIPAQEQRDRLVEDITDAIDAAWDAATTAANTRAGDAGNEAEKDARRAAAVKKILDRSPMAVNQNRNLAEVDAIVKEAQG